MRPVYDMLAAAADRASFHMPGHKGHAPFGCSDMYALDTTELPLTDDLYCPENGVAKAQELYAQAAGAAATLFLHNGSTAGIHAMLLQHISHRDSIHHRSQHTHGVSMGALHFAAAIFNATPEIAAADHKAHLNAHIHTFLDGLGHLSDLTKVKAEAVTLGGFLTKGFAADLQQDALVLDICHKNHAPSYSSLHSNIESPK